MVEGREISPSFSNFDLGFDYMFCPFCLLAFNLLCIHFVEGIYFDGGGSWGRGVSFVTMLVCYWAVLEHFSLAVLRIVLLLVALLRECFFVPCNSACLADWFLPFIHCAAQAQRVYCGR